MVDKEMCALSPCLPAGILLVRQRQEEKKMLKVISTSEFQTMNFVFIYNI